MLRKTPKRGAGVRGEAVASMRPQRNAAENLRGERDRGVVRRRASMRPQRNAAENKVPHSAPACRIARFNEAAA